MIMSFYSIIIQFDTMLSKFVFTQIEMTLQRKKGAPYPMRLVKFLTDLFTLSVDHYFDDLIQIFMVDFQKISARSESRHIQIFMC